jgi:hypothetical protein
MASMMSWDASSCTAFVHCLDERDNGGFELSAAGCGGRLLCRAA